MTPEEFIAEWNNSESTLSVHTSGSTGTPKVMRVEKSRMLASARMTCNFLNLQKGDKALLCLSTDYIAGKMMMVRSIERELDLTIVTPTNRPFSSLPSNIHFQLVAMIPSQVHDSIDDPRMRTCDNIIIGGGAIPDALELQLQDFPNNIWSTYGMTETLSHIAMRRINGKERREYYTPLPGVEISTDEMGCLIINAPHLHPTPLHTHDIVEITEGKEKRFRIIGRSDNIICSGGIKIQAEEVERLLQSHLDAPFMITKTQDEKFGEAVVLLTESENIEQVKALCHEVLPKYWQPKHYVHVTAIPMTPNGKLARKSVLLEDIASLLK